MKVIQMIHLQMRTFWIKTSPAGDEINVSEPQEIPVVDAIDVSEAQEIPVVSTEKPNSRRKIR